MWYKNDALRVEFETVEYRNFIIGILIKSGLFSSDGLSLSLQCQEKNKFIECSDLLKLVEFLSKNEKHIDSLWENGNYCGKNKGSEWLRFWTENLNKLQSDIQNLTASKCDLEDLNLYVASSLKYMVLCSAKDSIKFQKHRYLLREKPNFIQKLFWKLRSLSIEWRWGKRKKILGNFEKFDTQKEHSSSKSVNMVCGYCGAKIEDDWSRPKGIIRFDPLVFQITHDQVLTLTSETSVSKYEKYFTCGDCGSNLKYAHINKVCRAVSVVLL